MLFSVSLYIFLLLLLLLLSCFSRVQPHRRQPTRLPPSLGFSRQEHWSGLPFPSPMHERKSESEVAQSCLTLRGPMDCSLPSSSVHGIFQARVLEWGAIAFSILTHTASQFPDPPPFAFAKSLPHCISCLSKMRAKLQVFHIICNILEDIL